MDYSKFNGLFLKRANGVRDGSEPTLTLSRDRQGVRLSQWTTATCVTDPDIHEKLEHLCPA